MKETRKLQYINTIRRDQQRSGPVPKVLTRVPFGFQQSKFDIGIALSTIAMLAFKIQSFMVMIYTWMGDDPKNQFDCQERLESLAECLSRVIRHLGSSNLTEHLGTLWVNTRRALCSFKGVKLEVTADISISAIGAVPRRTRGFRALRELDHCILQNELEASREIVRELIVACEPETQLEKAMQLILDTMEDMMIIINAPIEISS